MPDIYATIHQQPRDVVETLARAMEARAASPQQRAMLEKYLSDVVFPDKARVLEIGCGAGPIAEVLASWPGVTSVTGIDPSPVMIEKARELRGHIKNLSFREGDGRALPFGDGEFDVVVIHTVLCHVPQPERVLTEAFRVLRPAGQLAVFDGDYETISVSIHQHDPLHACGEHVKASFVNDVWLARKLRAMIAASGFQEAGFASHGYSETTEPTYMLTIVDRGADGLVKDGVIGNELAEALKAEARRRVSQGRFFGHIGFTSLIACKPG